MDLDPLEEIPIVNAEVKRMAYFPRRELPWQVEFTNGDVLLKSDKDVEKIRTSILILARKCPQEWIQVVGRRRRGMTKNPPEGFSWILPGAAGYEDIPHYRLPDGECAKASVLNALTLEHAEKLERDLVVGHAYSSLKEIVQFIRALETGSSKWEFGIYFVFIERRVMSVITMGTYIVVTKMGHCYTIKMGESIVIDGSKSTAGLLEFQAEEHRTLSSVAHALRNYMGVVNVVYMVCAAKRSQEGRRTWVKRQRKVKRRFTQKLARLVKRKRGM
jgi:hypothetical protein